MSPVLRNLILCSNIVAAHNADCCTHRTLDKLNRTPFFIPVGPGKKARNAQVEATMERGREERERREETRRDGFGNQVRMEETTKDLVRGQSGIKQIGGSGKKAAPNKKFVFVDDNGEFDQEEADDEELIQQGLEATYERTKMLSKVSNLMGEDIERSNARLDRIGQKVSLLIMWPFFILIPLTFESRPILWTIVSA